MLEMKMLLGRNSLKSKGCPQTFNNKVRVFIYLKHCIPVYLRTLGLHECAEAVLKSKES